MKKSDSKGDLSLLAKDAKKPLFPSTKPLGSFGAAKSPITGTKTGISISSKITTPSAANPPATSTPSLTSPAKSSLPSAQPSLTTPPKTVQPTTNTSPAAQKAAPSAAPLAMKSKPVSSVSSTTTDSTTAPKSFAEMMLLIDKKLNNKSQEYDAWSAALDSREKELDELEKQVQKKEEDFQNKAASSEKELQMLECEIKKIEDRLLQLPKNDIDSEKKRNETFYEIDLKTDELIQKIQKRALIYKNVYETYVDILDHQHKKAEQKK